MSPLTRHERLVLAAITALGLALRAEGLGELSLAHFDEGVLMSSAFDVRLKGLWQFTLAQPLQSPPLYPWLVSGLMWLTGFDSPHIGVYASALFGSATVPLFFLLARRWGGNRFGLVAAALLATSDLHIAFSRMALTDAALTFWFVLAMYAFARLREACTRSAPITDIRVNSPAKTTSPATGVWRWPIALGVATAAAWNTKYNGWMPLAIAATACAIGCLRQTLAALGSASRTGADGQRCPGGGDTGASPRPSIQAKSLAPRGNAPATRFGVDAANLEQQRPWRRLLLAWCVAGAIALICFLPWYRYVERTLPGGYAAVTQNHLSYVGGLGDWPRRAATLFVSLSAFRHFGWALAIGALVAALAWQATMALTHRRVDTANRRTTASFVLGAAGIAAAAIIGTDAICLLIAITAIVPALIWGRFEQIVLAVWVGAFVVVTPFYHPYTRLLVPMLPGAIGLTQWAAEGCRPNLSLRRAASAEKAINACCAAAIVLGLAAAVAAHPFGWVPNKVLWHRWSTRQSYRAFNDAVREHTPADAHILCQGMPIMPLYIERRWDPLGHVPFTAWLGHVPGDRPCYLAVDFWGLYGEHHEAARSAIAEHLDALQPIAWVEDDLNVATLLDYLPPAGVARRISQDWPAQSWNDGDGRAVIVPAQPRDDRVNLIVLYRIDRERIGH